MFNNQRDYYTYYTGPVANSFAACVDKKDGPLSGIFAWGCQVQEDWKTQGKKPLPANKDMGLSGLDKEYQKKYPSSPPNTIGGGLPSLFGGGGGSPSNTKGTGDSAKCKGCKGGDIGCEIGKAFCEFTGALGDATGSTFDVFGKYMPYFIVGGVAIAVILIIKK